MHCLPVSLNLGSHSLPVLQLLFFMTHYLNLYTISSLYSECHALSQAKLALSPDPLVCSALEYKIKLSSSYAKKLSSVTQTNKLVSPILKSSSHLSPSQRYSYAKIQIKYTLNDTLTSFYEGKIHPLLVQGSFLKLLHLENSDSDWLSFVYSLPRGVMSFVLRSFIDCLPSLAA